MCDCLSSWKVHEILLLDFECSLGKKMYACFFGVDCTCIVTWKDIYKNIFISLYTVIRYCWINEILSTYCTKDQLSKDPDYCPL